jgi:Fe-S cluster assembly iron-binding protein IscA
MNEVRMIEVTQRAGEKLKATLDRAKAAPKLCVRVEVTLARGGTLRIDEERPGDTTLEFGGRKVLVLDKQAAEMYAGRQLDYAEGQFGFV